MRHDGGRAAPGEIDFLVCPPDAVIESFAGRPAEMDPGVLKAVSKHLARCALCRQEADRLLRGAEAAGGRGPWAWALAALAGLVLCGGVFLHHELARRGEGWARGAGARPDARAASLARFDPPDDGVPAGSFSEGPALPGAGPPAAGLSAEDARQLAAARASLGSGSHADAARLLEDLSLRHPRRGGIRLLLAYASARAEDFEAAHRHYAAAEAQGMGARACWGLANACLRLGDIACARRELTDHLLARDPDDEAALDLLRRLSASQAAVPR
ncbi:MAG TPA: hypothetical protein VJV23_14255 [Candidatus Polarisedimenticolia bacterium]|nr:hypothetical protein [Candidatus Polarisedimenticolia bacterium]